MKLMYCKECHDIVNISSVQRICNCGKCRSVYIDSLNIEYSGPGLIIGINNTHFVAALVNRMTDKKNHEFTAFFIQEDCNSTRKVR